MKTPPAAPEWERPLQGNEAVAYVCAANMLAALLNALGAAAEHRNREQIATTRREIASTGRLIVAVAEGNDSAARRITDEARARLDAMGMTE